MNLICCCLCFIELIHYVAAAFVVFESSFNLEHTVTQLFLFMNSSSVRLKYLIQLFIKLLFFPP